MTRDELIEKMARALEPEIWEARYDAKPPVAREITLLQAEAAISAIEAVACVVPPFGIASAQAEESAGKALYEHFAFYPNEQKPAWTPAGNAIRQDDARRLAMCAVNAWLAASPFRSKP